MTNTEIVRTCWLAVQQAEKHEMEETFKFKNHTIYNSHINVNYLVELCEENHYEHRQPPAKKKSYLVKVSIKDICPFCGEKITGCHIGEYCSGNCGYVDGYISLTDKDAFKFRNLIN